MSFIGNRPDSFGYSTTTYEHFNGDSSNTTFTLSRSVTSNSDIQVVVNNVIQDPGVSYYVQNLNSLVFTSAPSTGTDNIYVVYRNFVNTGFGLPANSVGSDIIASRSILTRHLGEISNINSGTSSLTLQSNNVVVSGNLTVEGATTTINVETLTIEDKNIVIANVASPTNITADGAGITVLGGTNKTLTWVSANNAWESSENVNLVSGKSYRIGNTSVLTSTGLGSGVLSSSLTSVGTLSSLAVSGNSLLSNVEYLGNLTGGTGVVSIGSGQIYKDVSGNVGIGTNSPASSLHITGPITANPNANGVMLGVQSNFAQIKLYSPLSTGGILDFGVAGADFKGRILYNNANNFMQISTNGIERIRIDSSGNVGLGGVTSPSFPIDIGASDNSIAIRVRGRVSDTLSAIIFDNNAGNAGTSTNYIQSGTSSPYIAFGTSNTERLRITSAGNVGVGTTSPSYALEVHKQITIKGNNPSTNEEYQDWPDCSFNIRRSDNYSQNGITMASFGYRSDPTYFTDNVVCNIRIRDQGQPASCNTSSSTTKMTLGSPGTFSIITGNSSERFFIDSSGNVGIGATSPDTKLHVYSTGNANDAHGLIKAEASTASNNVNASLTTKNWSGTSQFMQWENYGLRIGSRILTNYGQGNIYFTTGSDTVKATLYNTGGHFSATGNLNTNRGRLAFSSLATDPNHSIYNNYNNLDGEGSWDGMKMNVYAGLSVRIGNAGGGATPTTALYVDGSGRVTTPQKPRFESYRSGNLTNYTGGTAIIYNNATVNVGSHYNASTGLFTAPVAGNYIFQAGVYMSAAIVQLWPVINGTRSQSFLLDNSGTGTNLTGTTIIYLNANDTFGVTAFAGFGTGLTVYENGVHTYFRGHLIS